MPIYDLGDGVNLRHLVRDRDGNPVDATVSLTITLPSGTTTGVVVTRTALGQYDANTYVPPVSGGYRYKFTVSGAVVDVEEGTFTVADPGPAVYSIVSSVKRQIGKVTTDDRDEDIQLALLAASRMIDAATGRWPGAFVADAAPSLRTFPTAGRVLKEGAGYMRYGIMVDDIASSTGLTVSGGTYGSGIYSTVSSVMFGPDNALVWGQPITWLSLPYTVFSGIDSVQVTARWGWPTIPPEVEMATRLLAARLYRRRDSPQGVITSADWGAVRVSRTDPDVYALISHLSIPGFA